MLDKLAILFFIFRRPTWVEVDIQTRKLTSIESIRMIKNKVS